MFCCHGNLLRHVNECILLTITVVLFGTITLLLHETFRYVIIWDHGHLHLNAVNSTLFQICFCPGL